MCAGIGGMRLAFESLGGKCVFASEWNSFCQITYRENFGDLPQGDITKIPIEKIPKHDILLAGFPCQPFSKSGIGTRRCLKKLSGFSDKEQGKIFFHIAKIIKRKKPKAILLENVPRLLTMDNGAVFDTIVKKLEKLGYGVSYKVINSDKIVAQKRSRLYIVALLNKAKFEFPELPNLNPQLKNILEKRVDPKYILSDELWRWLKRHSKKHAKKGNGFGFRLANPKGVACTLSARYGKDGSEILVPVKGNNPRKLTPRECARIMGFSDNFKISVSDTQAYKQFGNSVVVPVIYLLGHEMMKLIQKERSSLSTIIRLPEIAKF